MGRVTITDVAKAAGVGLSTVDRVINGRRPVRADMAKRVLDAAESIGFYGVGLIRDRVQNKPAQLNFDFILQRKATPLYRLLGEALLDAARSSGGTPIKVKIHFMEDFTPRVMASTLLALAGKSDGVGLVAADHPVISQAIADLAAHGTPTLALLTNLTAPACRGYVGMDFWKIGRVAGWAIAHLCKEPGKVGVVIGSHRYLSQEANEIGLRSYFRQHASGFKVLEPVASLEDAGLACEATLELLAHNPDLKALYVAGGGIEGVVEALRDSPRPANFVTICQAVTEVTSAALLDDTVQVILSHPYKALAIAAIEALSNIALRPPELGLIQTLTPFEFISSETL